MGEPTPRHFTSARWAIWYLRKTDVVARWLNGAVVLDPAAGNGALLRAVISLALESGASRSNLPLKNLLAYDVCGAYLTEYRALTSGTFGLELPASSTRCVDFLDIKETAKADIVLMNPPWMQYGTAPEALRKRLAPLFKKYGLVENMRKALLGSSRADLAGLFVARVIAEATEEDADVHAFLPAALFFGDGASRGFRAYRAGLASYRLLQLYDLEGCDVFSDVNVRSCIAHFDKRGTDQVYPIPLFGVAQGTCLLAEPFADPSSALRVVDPEDQSSGASGPKLRLVVHRPRQGVNTCGANDALIFSNVRAEDGEYVRADSGFAHDVLIPRSFLHPFVFQDDVRADERRFVLLCYDQLSGKILPSEAIEMHQDLWNYLLLIRNRLLARRGTLIRASMKVNRWWTLLGVGPYSFRSHKIVWRSFGVHRFAPKIVRRNGDIVPQGNQALHASICFDTESEVAEALDLLQREEVVRELDSLKSHGLPSFAQPGRMKMVFEKLFDVEYRD